MTETCTGLSRITLSLSLIPTSFLRQCLSKQLRFGLSLEVTLYSGWSCTYSNPRQLPPLHIRTTKLGCLSSFSLLLLNLLISSKPLTPTPLPFPPSLSSDPMEDSLRKPAGPLQLPSTALGSKVKACNIYEVELAGRHQPQI